MTPSEWTIETVHSGKTRFNQLDVYELRSSLLFVAGNARVAHVRARAIWRHTKQPWGKEAFEDDTPWRLKFLALMKRMSIRLNRWGWFAGRDVRSSSSEALTTKLSRLAALQDCMAGFWKSSLSAYGFRTRHFETSCDICHPLQELRRGRACARNDEERAEHAFDERRNCIGSSPEHSFGERPIRIGSRSLFCRSSSRVFHWRCFSSAAFGRRSSHSFIVFIAILLLFFACSSLASTEHIPTSSKDTTFSTNYSANAVRREGIDDALRKYAFMALSHVRTGIVYNVSLTPHFNGITAQAIRLRSGSVKRRGLTFNEFNVPEGATVTGGPVVVMIYRKIFNFTVYALPPEYDFVAPVVGIVLYTTPNISFDDEPLPEMSITSQKSPITVRVPISQPIGKAVPLCAFFDVNGSVTFTNVSSLPNVCSSASLGDVSLVSTSGRPSLPPSPTPRSAPVSAPSPPPSSTKKSRNRKVLLAIIFGAIGGLVVLSIVAIFGVRLIEKVRIAIMERFADSEETLQTSLIGTSRAPTAAGLRTRPSLEMDYVQRR